MVDPSPASASPPDADQAGQYVVVARRYRPQTFDELVGQEHVARALSNAIVTNRVGHAYLFCGARGVGKTSAARILAKALNCQQGPSPTPCNACDICQAVSSGDDVDVVEIDGASNRGIDEMRNLRQNANVRPSRSGFKIYIIDEVHMLTLPAFNALLKTLEEPPEHVKFIFCTTEPEKIPITILSRCQRFDFAGIQADSIAGRLRQIVDTEGVAADTAALEVLARRAGGSMRDSQSLLEQLLSFGGEKLTLADVHHMLGTAAEGRLGTLLEHLVARDAAAALSEVDAALGEGVDAGQLVEQLVGYLRDLMVAAVGAPPEILLYCGSGQHPQVAETARQLGLETILAMLQILDHTLERLRYSTQRRTLVELALVRMCALADLQQISNLVAQLQAGGAASLPQRPAATASSRTIAPSAGLPKKKSESQPRPSAPVASGQPSPDAAEQRDTPPVRQQAVIPLTEESAPGVWQQVLDMLGDMTADCAAHYSTLAISAPNRLVVGFSAKYTSSKTFCEEPERIALLQRALKEITGSAIQIEFVVQPEKSEASESQQAPQRPVSARSQLQAVSEHTLVSRAGELFGARPVGVEQL